VDLFRGMAMLIIFVAHVPDNAWNGFIPARFGFSNATEIFVFCSGFASALAFGGVFTRRGFGLGLARIAFRCWQVYWAHISVFMAMLALYATADRLLPGQDYLVYGGFERLLQEPARALMLLMTLGWQTDYLDILPMYLVILAMIPVVMLLRRLHPLAPFAGSIGLYLAVWLGGLALVSDPWSGAPWFLNPFGWQLIFFAGFAVASGWWQPPALRQPWLVALCAAYVVLAVPLSWHGVLQQSETLTVLRGLLLFGDERGNFHVLRFLHFLALAYLALSLVDPWRQRIGDGASALVVKVGQQSLAAFLASLLLARAAGILLDVAGRDWLTVAAVNLAGMGLMVAVAFVVGWFKAAPWSAPAPTAARTGPGGTAAPRPQPAE
jgi:hypothetical protein